MDKESGEIITVVLRDFVQSHFTRIKDWGVNLIKDTVSRRLLSQRNGPGQLARVGVSEGPRNARLFGWVRNLKKKYRTAVDRYTHE